MTADATFGLNATLNQRTEQTQGLNHQQIQTLKMVQMSSIELNQYLEQKMLTNPALEVHSNLEKLCGNPIEDSLNSGDYDPDRAAKIVEQDENQLDQLNNCRDNGDKFDYSSIWTSDDDEKRNYGFNSLTAKTTLRESLYDQLRDSVDSRKNPMLFHACDEVIGNLDSHGYLKASDDEIARGAGVDLALVRQAIEVVQSFNPAGIGGHDLREVLLLQLARNHEKGSIAWDIVDNHLDELARNKIPQIAASVDADISEVQEAVARIRELNPYPCSELSDDTAQTILPEIEIRKNDTGDWTITKMSDAFPEVSITSNFMKMQRQASKDEREYFTNMRKEAEMLISSLEFRKSTIEKISEILLKLQLEFFEKGPTSLKPLTRAKVAEIANLSESTIGRAVDGKFMITPYGIKPFSFFFTSGVGDDSGNAISSKVIQDKIAAYVNAENKSKPLSDEKIVELLEKDGYKIARRTVAKYREAAGIPGTSLRRIHT